MIIHFEELHKSIILPHGPIYLLAAATESPAEIGVPLEESISAFLIEETVSVLIEKTYCLSHKLTELLSLLH